jgi:hypothetical protein
MFCEKVNLKKVLFDIIKISFFLLIFKIKKEKNCEINSVNINKNEKLLKSCIPHYITI